jgi:Protein of unknown function (DUF3618)
VASDPEELLRSIERTREELAHTVDTIAGRLDPKRAAKRGVGALRDGVTGVVEGARAKLHVGGENGGATANGAAGAKRAAGVVPAKLARVGPLVRRVRKPAAGALAALLALAAIVAVRRRRR